MGIQKHSPKYIKKSTLEKPAIVVSMPSQKDVDFKTAEELLATDITLTGNAAAKTVSIKLFGNTEVLPTEARMLEVLTRLEGFLPKTEYALIEAQQMERFNQSLKALDVKDLDVEAFMAYWSSAAKLSDIGTLTTRIEDLERQIQTKTTSVDGLAAELANRPHSQKRLSFNNLAKDANGYSYFDVVVESGLRLADAIVFSDGILVEFDYTVSRTGRVTFMGEIGEKIQAMLFFSGMVLQPKAIWEPLQEPKPIMDSMVKASPLFPNE